MSVEEETISFLNAILPLSTRTETDSEIFVTVTFAQSLDAKIAGKGGRKVLISGEQSMRMTHQYVICRLDIPFRYQVH